jgi:hypothetical protein
MSKPGGTLETLCDAEIDQAGRNPHHDITRLNVEVNETLVSHVLKDGRDVQGERQQLIQRYGRLLFDQAAQGWAFQMLKHHVRVSAVKHGIETPHEAGVRQTVEHFDFATKLAESVRIFGLVRP